jgi:two-component system response regulator
LIAVSVFLKGLQPAEVDRMLGEFGTLLEKYLRPVFEQDMERMLLEEKEPAIASEPTERSFKRYLKWLSNLHTRFGMRSEPLGHGTAASLTKTKCSWLEAAKVNPIHCRICDLIAQKSFAWSGLKGKVSITGTIAGGAPRCHYEFAIVEK